MAHTKTLNQTSGVTYVMATEQLKELEAPTNPTIVEAKPTDTTSTISVTVDTDDKAQKVGNSNAKGKEIDKGKKPKVEEVKPREKRINLGPKSDVKVDENKKKTRKRKADECNNDASTIQYENAVKRSRLNKWLLMSKGFFEEVARTFSRVGVKVMGEIIMSGRQMGEELSDMARKLEANVSAAGIRVEQGIIATGQQVEESIKAAGSQMEKSITASSKKVEKEIYDAGMIILQELLSQAENRALPKQPTPDLSPGAGREEPQGGK